MKEQDWRKRYERVGAVSKLSPPREIVRAVFLTYPGEKNLTYADELSAKWVSNDCIRVVLHTRKDWLDSWFNAILDPTLICRHNNWKVACGSCKNVVKNGIDKWLEQMAKEQERALQEEPDKPRYRLGKEPGRL